jgi:hypothetical protein
MTNTQAGWSACDYTFPGDRPCIVGVHPNHPHGEGDHRPARWLVDDHYTRLAATVSGELLDPVKTANVLRDLYEILGQRGADLGGGYVAEQLAAYVCDLANMLEDWEGRTESGVGAPHLSGTQRCECVIGEDHAFDAPEPDELEVRR